MPVTKQQNLEYKQALMIYQLQTANVCYPALSFNTSR